jgi:branched-chain amino acid transport system substrate-binding protein
VDGQCRWFNNKEGTMKHLPIIGAALGLALSVAGPAAAQVKLGLGAPITGPNATFGSQYRNGVELAVEDINASGGLLGQKVTVVIGDDVSDPKQGVSVANKFIAEGVKFVVGHFNSGVTIPASEAYNEGGVLMITPSATNPKITERGLWNVFRACGRDDQQGSIAGAFLVERFKGKRIAIGHDKTPAAQGLASETKKALNAAGVKEVLLEAVNPGEKDYTALVSKLKSANVDLFYWGGLHTEGGLIVRQMRDQALNTVLMAGDGIATEEYAAIGGPGVEGTLMTFFPNPENRPEAKEVLNKFRAKGIDPAGYTLYAYAATQILKQAVDKAGSLEPKKVAETMHSGMPFKTVLGDISFDSKGDIKQPGFVPYVWRNTGSKITFVELDKSM